MLSLAQGRELIRTHVAPLDPAPCALAEAHGRVLREEVRAREDFPAFDRSSMDGYAIARDDDSAAFRVIGEVQPGAAEDLAIGRGECVRIFTGAAIPRGASQVLMQEDVRREGELMIPETRPSLSRIGAVLTLRSMLAPSLRCRAIWRPVNPTPSRSRSLMVRCSAALCGGMKGSGFPIDSSAVHPKVPSAALFQNSTSPSADKMIVGAGESRKASAKNDR